MTEFNPSAAIKVGPTDILVIAYHSPLSMEKAQGLRDGIATWAGIDPCRVVILDGVQALAAVERPEIAAVIK